MTAQLVIAGITIKTDDEGRYCLNDFHRAAGGTTVNDIRDITNTLDKRCHLCQY